MQANKAQIDIRLRDIKSSPKVLNQFLAADLRDIDMWLKETCSPPLFLIRESEKPKVFFEAHLTDEGLEWLNQ